MNIDVKMEITTYLYGEVDQLDALKFLLWKRGYDHYHAWHRLDDWILLDIDVFSHTLAQIPEFVVGSIIYYVHKDCYTLVLLRNIKMSIELGPTYTIDHHFLRAFICHCLGNGCMMLFLEIRIIQILNRIKLIILRDTV